MTKIVDSKYLPSIAELFNVCKTATILDMIMKDEKESWLRLYNIVDVKDKQNATFSIDNGSGDNLFIVFSNVGCIIKGFDHESPLSPHAQDEYKVYEGIYEDVPEKLLMQLADNMFEKEDVTLCIWREANATDWLQGNVVLPEGLENDKDYLLGYLVNNAQSYKEWADDYYDVDLPLKELECIYKGEPVTKELVQAINSDRNFEEFEQEYQKAGISNL